MRELPFNDYVAIQEATVTRDAIGAETLTWATLRSIWCRVGDLSVQEYVAANEPQSRRQVKVRGYAVDLADVAAKMRIVHGSRTLEVEGLVQSDWGDRATLMCWEVAP